MAVREKAEILDDLRKMLGDEAGDEAISLVEDLTDTLTHLEESAGEDWRAKYEANDAEWRKKYVDRFYSNPPDDKEKEEDKRKEAPRTFADLFKTV